MIYLFGLSVAALLFVLILLQKGRVVARYILLAWMGVVIVHLTLFILYKNGFAFQYPFLLGSALPLPILHGVFLYFYALALIKPDVVARRLILIHLTPFFLLTLLAIPFFLMPASEMISVIRKEGGGLEWYSTIRMAGFFIAGISYSFIVIVMIRRHRHQMLDTLSNVDMKMLIWLEYLAIGLALIWTLSIFFGNPVVFGGVALFVLLIGLFGVNQHPVFYMTSPHHGKSGSSINISASASQPLWDDSKYAKSKLSEEQAVQLMDRLEVMMRTRRPYTDPHLTLNDLAGQMHVSPRELSQVINSVSARTFYHYVNTYRIHDFLKLAESPANRRLTFLALAYQCGFSSRMTFKRYFKLVTGKTPSSYFGLVMEEGAGA